MADIFDKITEKQSGDVFDRVTEKGADIFDTLDVEDRPIPELSAPPEDYRQHEVIGPEIQEPGKYSIFPEGGESLYDAASRSARKALPMLGKYAAQAQQFVGESFLPTVFGGGEKTRQFYDFVGSMGRESANELQKRIDKIDQERPTTIQGRLWDNPQYLMDPRWLLENTAEAAISFAPTVAAWFVGGAPAAGLVGGTLEGGSLYHELIEEGVEPGRAGIYSTAYGIVSGILNSVGAGKVLRGTGARTLVKRLAGGFVGGLVEATTEYAEEPFEAAAGALARGKDWQGVVSDTVESLKNVDVIPGSFIMGGGGTIASDAARPTQVKAIEKILAKIEKTSKEQEKVSGKTTRALANTMREKMVSDGLKNTLAFSAERSSLDQETNKKNTELAEKTLSNLNVPYRKVEGFYEGAKEQSFVIPNTEQTRALAETLAKRFGQESILNVGPDGVSSRVFMDGGTEQLPGVVKEVTEEQAKKAPGYTKDPETGKYFTNVEQQAVSFPAAETPTVASYEDVMAGVGESEAAVARSDQKGFITIGKAVPQAPTAPLVESVNSKVESVMTAAEGIPHEYFWGKLGRGLKSVAQQRLHHPLLSPKKFGAVLNTLRIFDAAPQYSKAKATNSLAWITEGLDKGNLRIFTRVLVLEDLMKDLEHRTLAPEELPGVFGYENQQEVYQDYANFSSAAQSSPQIMQALERRKTFMRALREELVSRKLLPEAVLDDDRYFHHQVLESLGINGQTVGLYSGDVRLHKKGWQRGRSGKGHIYNTAYAEAEFEVISQAISQIETQKALSRLKEQADISGTITEEAQQRDIPFKRVEDLERFFPEGYVAWRPTKGSRFFPAMTITEKALTEVLAGERALEQEDLRGILAVGRRENPWVIPEELAATLETYRDFAKDELPARIAKKSIHAWKQWILLNPFRVIKYNVNNMSGDLDICLAYNPKIVKYAWQAYKDVNAHRRGKTMHGDVEEAVRYGVMDSGFVIHEVSDITKQQFHRMITGEKPNLIARYWRATKEFTNMRENILRLAAYRFFKDELTAGNQHYGASNPAEIDAVTNLNERAAKLARELIGDYGNISKAGQWLRERLIPFWSWMEINAPRYVRMMRNTMKYDQGGGTRMAGVAAWSAAKKVAGLGFRTMLLFHSVYLWNLAMAAALGLSPDDRDRLTRKGGQLHMILFKDQFGEVHTLRFQGALSDALDFLAMEDPYAEISKVIKGDVPLSDKVLEMVKAPAEKLIHGAAPILKTAGEVLMGRTLYPDPFNPRPIRDRLEHALRLLSLDMPYRHFAGKPTRGWARDIAAVALYSRDPNEQAYYDNYNKVRDFMKGQKNRSPVILPNEYANTLYYIRQSIKYGDLEAAEKYLEKFIELGGKIGNLRKSLKRLHPLAPVPEDLRGKYIAGLNKAELRTLEKALRWYKDTFVYLDKLR